MIVAKRVDYLLETGIQNLVDQFLDDFKKRYTIGKVANGTGRLRFYALNIIQEDDNSTHIHADDKLSSLEPYPISSLRLRDGPIVDETYIIN